MEAFTYLAPDTWTLRDVVLTLNYRHRMAAILSSSQQTRGLVSKYLLGSETDRSVLATLDTFMAGLTFVAAAWHHCDQPPVLRERQIDAGGRRPFLPRQVKAIVFHVRARVFRHLRERSLISGSGRILNLLDPSGLRSLAGI